MKKESKENSRMNSKLIFEKVFGIQLEILPIHLEKNIVCFIIERNYGKLKNHQDPLDDPLETDFRRSFMFFRFDLDERFFGTFSLIQLKEITPNRISVRIKIV